MTDALRILFVDNDPATRELVADALKPDFPDLRITGVTDEDTLVSALGTDGFDLAVTDYGLRWASGSSVVARLKERWADCPVVLFSVSGEDQLALDRAKASAPGSAQEQPESIALLAGTLRAALERSNLLQQRRRAEEALRISDAQRRRAEREVRRSYRELQRLSAHVVSIQERERTSIAREIHDQLGQALTAIRIEIAWLQKRLQAPSFDRPALDLRLAALAELIDTTIGQVRRISAELRPRLLDEVGLVAALEWQAQDFQARTGIGCTVRSLLPDNELDRDASTALFRIFQECLTNVARHAQATSTETSLRRERGRVILEVRDDGNGISPESIASRGSLGLLGIQERTRLLGGQVRIYGRPEGGTRITVSIPQSPRALEPQGVRT